MIQLGYIRHIRSVALTGAHPLSSWLHESDGGADARVTQLERGTKILWHNTEPPGFHWEANCMSDIMLTCTANPQIIQTFCLCPFSF